MVILLLVLILSACSDGASDSGDSDYPKKPVTLMLPYGSGGTTDLYFREFTNIAEEHLGQRIVIKNETGGGGLSMYSSLVNADPDGYTMAAGMGTSLYAINPHLDLMDHDGDDFTLVSPAMQYQYVFVAPSDAPYQTFEELIEYSKENSLTFAASSTTNHLFAETVNKAENFDLQWKIVNYTSDSESIAAVLGGHVDFTLVSPIAVSGSEQAGDINYLAVTPEKFESHPDVPTMDELGYDLDITAMIGIGGPKGLPSEVEAKWEDVINKTLKDPKLIEFAAKNHYTLPNMSQEEMDNFFTKQRERFGEVIDRVVE
ncbi:tripartite tricarboxylate transporter substrate binding protein [Oceanobacillus halophilus]|uniref:Tripartite tricarboxylate transporter substrate binding protein n=1 Tax=Oceanobacillus halophilus TaxID=930130 RepID=A0A495A8V1_9BACI|nr:tripartite tricarboxylate transporter substrate binding protein [Oceanobacillus halophilus]RKQ35735.1 tripartite tricarboxylate transporter substrate binding protein [Oceanobacillus halophilus]